MERVLPRPLLFVNEKSITEARNPESATIDALPTEHMLRVINRADQQVALAVEGEIPRIAASAASGSPAAAWIRANRRA